MSAAPGAAEAPQPQTTAPRPEPLSGSCLSCRLISGGGLILSGAYVYHAARRLKRGGPPSIGASLQITFAAGLAALGVYVIADPMGKFQKKT